MLPYGIKFRFGSRADLREHQGTPLQQRVSYPFRHCIKFPFGSCADVGRPMVAPTRKRMVFCKPVGAAIGGPPFRTVARDWERRNFIE